MYVPPTKADATDVHPRAFDVGQDAEDKCAIKAGFFASGLALDISGVVAATPFVGQGVGAKDVWKVCWHPGEK
jgi:hypothetical protein